MDRAKGRTVYSVGPFGREEGPPAPCRRCGSEPCACEPASSLEPRRQMPRVRLERSGRQGKAVTVIAPLVLTSADAEALLTALKRCCGAGGTLKLSSLGEAGPCFEFEVQGDQVERAAAELGRQGYRARS